MKLRFCALLCAALSSAPTHAATPTAEVQAVQAPAWLERDGRLTPLAAGQPIRSGDVIVSGAGSRVLVGLADGSQIKLGSDGRFALDKINVHGNAGSTAIDASLRLLKGFFRYSSSTLGKLTGKRNIDLRVSTATIGIRGTDYWAMTDELHDAVCVFDGKVEVATRDQGTLTLDQPTAFWARFFEKPPQPVGVATPTELARFIATVEPVPGDGMTVANGRWRLVAAAEPKGTDARAIANALRDKGYPALLAKSYGLHEVRLDAYATRADAETALQRLSAQAGLTGNDAKVVAAR